MRLGVDTNRITAALVKDSTSRKILLSDPDDTPFIALASAVENDGIWSDEEHCKKQSRIGVWKTRELQTVIKKGLV